MTHGMSVHDFPVKRTPSRAPPAPDSLRRMAAASESSATSPRRTSYRPPWHQTRVYDCTCTLPHPRLARSAAPRLTRRRSPPFSIVQYLKDGSPGPAAGKDVLEIGDLLVAINGTNLAHKTYDQVRLGPRCAWPPRRPRPSMGASCISPPLPPPPPPSARLPLCR